MQNEPSKTKLKRVEPCRRVPYHALEKWLKDTSLTDPLKWLKLILKRFQQVIPPAHVCQREFVPHWDDTTICCLLEKCNLLEGT